MSPTAIIKDEDAIRSQKGLYILGKDIREVACLRSSLLLGISCGTFGGLISFMVTSKAAQSCHIGFGCLWLGVFAYWIPCRYKFETQKEITRQHTSQQLYERATAKRDSPRTEEEKS